MAEFDISYTTSYQSAIVTIALSCTIFELFDMKECRDFEGHSKSVADTHTIYLHNPFGTAYEFLFAFHYNHRFQNRAIYWSTITIFHTSFYWYTGR